MKCELCGKQVVKTFLDKPKGTYVKDQKGKLHLVCFECQGNLKDKASIIEKLK